MPKLSFKCCALQYLNQWLTHDRIYCEALAGNDEESDKLKALKKAAVFYRIARNLQTKYDQGIRYAFLLKVLDSQPPTISDTNLHDVIETTLDQISTHYGGREVKSLTTKFLWLKFKSPIIIYDSMAKAALKIKSTDIRAYYSAWRHSFNAHANEIDDACNSLQNVLEYSVNPQVATAQYVRKLAGQQWFQERVFDNYLWNLGPDDQGGTAF